MEKITLCFGTVADGRPEIRLKLEDGKQRGDWRRTLCRGHRQGS